MVNQTVPSSTGKWIAGCLASAIIGLTGASAASATVSQTPLFLTQGVEPQVMLSLSNDHQLFFEAYPDYLDLNGDGQPDLTYGHDNDYYGYFDSYKCYDYNTSTGRFIPAAETTNKYCDGVSGDWSGNFLNYLTMSRMDVVRKILFGGYRRVDTSTLTVLERAYIPTDAHSWVRYYDNRQGDLNKLSPFDSSGVVTATSNTNVTPSTGDITFNISSNTNAFMNSVQVGDQVRVFTGSGLLDLSIAGQEYMLGTVRSVSSNNNRITVRVARASGAVQRASWTVENVSRAGVSFCNTTNDASLNDGEPVPVGKVPRLSVASGNYALWNANERWQCRWSDEYTATDGRGINDNNIGVTEFGANDRSPVRGAVALGQQDYTVRVEACVSGLLGTERCKEYPDGNLKPIGLLQQYGDENQILFGLLSGSYVKNKSGGVLRKNVSGFGDEVNVQSDGRFTTPPSTGGIVSSLNLLRMYGYGTDGVYTRNSENCSFGLSSFPDGRCASWGNPQAEIFLESIRYFAGANPTSAFTFTGKDRLDGLQAQPWTDTLNEDLRCAPLNVINFNSSAASYDRDRLASVSDIPGSGGVAGIRSLVGTIGLSEGINGKEWFVGETTNATNQLCTSKVVGSLAEVAGLCPEAPRLSAGYDAVGIANYAYENDIRPNLTGDQNVKTFAVALAPAVPRIDISRPGSSEVAATILPACRNSSVGGNCAIVDFKIVRQDQQNGTGLFLINWEDSEQGGDYDQDMYGTLEYRITANTLTVTTRIGGQSTPNSMGFGYVLNGTTQNGFHAHSGINGFSYNDPGVTSCNNCLSGNAPTSHTYQLSTGATTEGLLESPMFYAAKWAGYDKQGNFPDDPASWDADGDGLPDNYYFAIDPSKLATDLELVFADILRSSSAAASVAASSSSLSTDTAVYQASFNSEDWSGDLRAFSIEPDGSVADTFDWSAAARLNSLSPGEIVNRNIITNDSLSTQNQVDGELLSNTGKEFRWNLLDNDQQLALRQNSDATQASAAVAELRVNYLRGDRSEERNLSTNPSGLFRERDGRLGDIINSNPQFIHRQNFGYQNLNGIAAFSGITAYNTFRASAVYQNRPPMVVVGANDGMLHGFNASTGVDAGKELFAYVPSDVMGNLAQLTELNYSHRYYVDGSPRVADAWLGNTLGWRTLAVGATGAGGRSIFAIDVTDPENITKDQLLWEFSHPDMGRTLQQPAIVPMPNGEFAVVVSSGIFDTAQANGGKVWVLNAATGRPITTIDLPDSGQLGAPLAVDLNNDRIIDRIYVGDSDGNLWRLDIEGTLASQWGSVPNALKNGNNTQPLFTAPPGQPITAQLTSAFNQKGEHMVFFGTGSFIRQGDNVVGINPDVQAFYGIIDRGVQLTVAELLEQDILARVTQNGNGLTAVTDRQIGSEGGWYINMVWKQSFNGPGPNGERVTSRALVRGDRVIFTSLIPSADACAAGGTSWLYEVDTLTGGRLAYAVFDINNDGVFNEDDFIEITDENGNTIRIPPSGLNPDIGILNTPVVLVDPISGNERKIFTGSSGQIISVPEAGSISRGRQNWEQIR